MWFREPLIEKHKQMIRKDNCRVSEVFELLLTFCTLGLILVSYFEDGYSAMMFWYIVFFILSIGLFFVTRFYVQNHLEYANTIMFCVLIESYTYSVFSGILYNLHSPSITVYALMVAACSAYLIPISFTIFFHTTVAIVYCILAMMLKPEYGVQDTINYIFFLSMSFVLTTIIYRTRLAFLRSIDDRQQLIDDVPTGIGIYEVKDGVISQNYMNDAYYEMLGSSRKSREQFWGDQTIRAVHPDDVQLVQDSVNKLIQGEDSIHITYRLKVNDDKWFWVHMSGSVVKREEHSIQIFASFSDYNEIVKAHEEMKTSQKTMEVALESAKVLAWRYDYKTCTIIDSGSLGEAYHLPKVMGNVPRAIVEMGFIASSSVDDFYQLYEKVRKEKIASVDVCTTVKRGAQSAWYRQIYTPMYDTEGNYTESIGIAIDITEQKIREQRYEEALQLHIAASKDALAVANYNLSQNLITEFRTDDSSLKDLARYQTADDMLASTNHTITDVEERKKFRIAANCKKLIRTFEEGTSHIEITHHFADSTRWMSTSFDMIKNPYTGDIEAVSIVRDITEKVRAELIANQLLVVDYQSILLIDIKTGKAFPFQKESEDHNLSEVMGLQEKEETAALGLEAFLRAYALPDKADQVVHENSIEYILERLQIDEYYETMYTLIQNEKMGHYRVIYSYLENEKDILLCAVQDVTDMYEQEERQKEELSKALVKAEAASKAKTAFLSRVSHDMRTPLNGILGISNLLKRYIEDQKGQEDLEELEMSGKYLLNLINDTLDVNRIESGKLELHPVVCDGRVLFSGIISLMKASMVKREITLEVSDNNLPFTVLHADSGRIQQVVMNVFSNALKFTPDGGIIEVDMRTLSIEDDAIVNQITIRDNGIGMSKEFVPHIFEAFSQEDATRTSSYQGTGLGMSITKQILEILGGEIQIESELGKGTCVTMVVPMNIATDEQVTEWIRLQIPKTKEADLNEKHILLCEDHPLNMKIAVRLLEAKGMIVDHAENGRIGVEMFCNSEEGFYDAILMDIRMPEMDGLDATRTIRALKREDAKRIPILAMTANALTEDIKQSKAAGMDVHLSKPIQPDLLYGALGTMMAHQ